MNAKEIFTFLKELSTHNTREWMQAHKTSFLSARQDFEEAAMSMLHELETRDEEIGSAHLTVKDVTFRINRDIRFSPDKSPYKNHFGAFFCAKGKKSLRGGYYFHLEPDHCMVAVGNYWLPTNILNACRWDIINSIELFHSLVETPEFKKHFPNGFGLSKLKTCPSGFPKDFPYMDYLRAKDYCCWKNVPDTFFMNKNWMEEAIDIFMAGKPMMDFVNSTIDDYE